MGYIEGLGDDFNPNEGIAGRDDYKPEDVFDFRNRTDDGTDLPNLRILQLRKDKPR